MSCEREEGASPASPERGRACRARAGRHPPSRARAAPRRRWGRRSVQNAASQRDSTRRRPHVGGLPRAGGMAKFKPGQIRLAVGGECVYSAGGHGPSPPRANHGRHGDRGRPSGRMARCATRRRSGQQLDDGGSGCRGRLRNPVGPCLSAQRRPRQSPDRAARVSDAGWSDLPLSSERHVARHPSGGGACVLAGGCDLVRTDAPICPLERWTRNVDDKLETLTRGKSWTVSAPIVVIQSSVCRDPSQHHGAPGRSPRRLRWPRRHGLAGIWPRTR